MVRLVTRLDPSGFVAVDSRDLTQIFQQSSPSLPYLCLLGPSSVQTPLNSLSEKASVMSVLREPTLIFWLRPTLSSLSSRDCLMRGSSATKLLRSEEQTESLLVLTLLFNHDISVPSHLACPVLRPSNSSSPAVPFFLKTLVAGLELLREMVYWLRPVPCLT